MNVDADHESAKKIYEEFEFKETRRADYNSYTKSRSIFMLRNMNGLEERPGADEISSALKKQALDMLGYRGLPAMIAFKANQLFRRVWYK